MSVSYVSLTHQVANLIRDGMESGRWLEWLPGERKLAEELGVSRRTIRQSLQLLLVDRLIRCETGKGNRILLKKEQTGRESLPSSIGLLISAPVELQRTFTTLWINELRSFLSKHNLDLRVFSGGKIFSTSPEKALRKLIGNEPQRAWVLAASTTEIQTWFESNQRNAVIVGSPRGTCSLPSIDVDYRAVGRHAAGEFLRAHHRKIAVLVGSPARGGDTECAAGFKEAVDAHRSDPAELVVVKHTYSSESIHRSVQKLLRRKSPPTAILVANSMHYLAVHTALLQLGINIPAEMTLLSRDDDPFLQFVHPEPSRYACPPALMAKHIGRLILRLEREPNGPTVNEKLVPVFIARATHTKPPPL